MLRSLAAVLAVSATLAMAAPAAADQDEAFFRSVVGQWTGPGEIVAGKYKGTKFVCNFSGAAHGKDLGMALDGSCRVGIFAQKMRAEVVRSGSSYKGAFQDGAAGKGLDIVSGNIDGDRMIVGLNRAQLRGAMVARLDGADAMNITVSVTVAQELVPVIGMNLTRSGPAMKHSALSN